ncbi:MAG: PaaI family thioesterase [Thermoplasmatales archaeon]|nr:PaaI family thioesterase [Thermoplasmatales archaeon]
MANPPASQEPRPRHAPRNLAIANRMRGFHHAVGFTIDPARSGEGYCTVIGTIREMHLNINRIVHGGVYATILDTAMGGAVVTTLGDGETTATTSLYLEFLRSTGLGTKIVARGDILRRGRHLAFVRGELSDSDGRLLSQAHGTWYIWSTESTPISRAVPKRRSAGGTSRRS